MSTYSQTVVHTVIHLCAQCSIMNILQFAFANKGYVNELMVMMC